MGTMTSWLTPQKRKCGECTACCYAIGVQELGKPFTTNCEYQCKAGCGIYNNRPGSCAEWECAWLGGVAPIDDRPDKVGYVIHNEIGPEGVWIDVFFTRPDNSCDYDRLNKTLAFIMNESPKGMVSRGVRFVLYGQIRNAIFEVNLKKYPLGANADQATPWASLDAATVKKNTMYLYAPLRGETKRRVALPMAEQKAYGQAAIQKFEERLDALIKSGGVRNG